MSDFFNLYPNGLPIHNPQWNTPQQPHYEPEWLARLVELEVERDDLRTQLTAVTAERDDYRARFRDLEHELQLERGQVVAQQQRREAAEAALVWANDKIKQLEQRLGIYST